MRFTTAPASDWLEELATETFKKRALAGLALGVVRDGRLERFIGLGVSDAATARPVAPDTVFRIGSVSKTMTAIGVLKLVEEGLVRLDDPVNEHLGAFSVEHRRPATPPVTIRQLLTHTSGIGELRRWSDLLRPTAALTVKRGRPLPDLADYYAPRLRPEAVPGTKWAYANHGFGVLGQLIADVRGEPFPQVMRREIFAPLQMDRTDFLRGERVDDRLAVGYRLRRGRLKPVNDRDVTVLPAGSCFSCLDDLMRYVSALVVGGAPLLRPGTLEQMLTPQGEPDARLPAMGLCFFLDRFGDHRVAGHDGSGLGFGSAMLFAPDDGVGVIAFTNTAVALAPQLLANRVLRRLLDVHESAVPRAPERPHHWSELAGVYKPPPGLNTNLRWWPLIGGEVEVTVRGGHLLARAPSLLKPLRKGVRLHAADADDPLLFVVRQADFAAPVAFVRGPDGRVCSLRTGSILGGFLRLERRPRATSLRLWGRVAGIGTLLGLGVRVARMRARPGPQRRFFR